jgi:hypothetical protein
MRIFYSVSSGLCIPAGIYFHMQGQPEMVPIMGILMFCIMNHADLQDLKNNIK